MIEPKENRRWHRQPVVWVAAAIMVATLIGCVVLIVLASRTGEVPIPGSEAVMKLPSQQGDQGEAGN